MNTNVSFYKEIKKLIKSDIINLSDEQIDSIYKSFSENFDNYDTVAKSSKFDKSLILQKQNVPEQSTLLGIDFPTWFGDEKKKKIMIVGIDPLRNKQVFEKANADINNEVLLGTPYGLHIKDLREKRTKAYWDFVSELSENHFVYLTDIYKTFFYTTNNTNQVRSYDIYKKEEKNLLLNHEIELINPDLIITFGGLAYKNITGTNSPVLSKQSKIIKNKDLKIDVAPMLHLSNSVRPTPLKNFFETNSIDVDFSISSKEKGKYFAKIVQKWMGK